MKKRQLRQHFKNNLRCILEEHRFHLQGTQAQNLNPQQWFAVWVKTHVWPVWTQVEVVPVNNRYLRTVYDSYFNFKDIIWTELYITVPVPGPVRYFFAKFSLTT